MGLEIVEPGVQAQYRPSADADTACYEFGTAFAEKVKEYHKKF